MNQAPGHRKRAPRRQAFRGAALGLCIAAAIGAVTGCGGGSEASAEADGAPPTGVPAAVNASTPPSPVTPRVVEPAPKPTGPLAPGTSCVSDACHATLKSERRVHVGVASGDCTPCHDADQGDHTYPRKRPGNETCTFCHTVDGAGANRHAPLDDPGCLACHAPHGGRAKFLLKEPTVRAVCLQCHLPESGSHPHGPFGQGECTACHRPHDADTRFLLRGGEGVDHCALCHEETTDVLANAPHVHPPAVEGCLGCHAPHVSSFPHTLRDSVTNLCFNCHTDLEAAIADATAPHAAVFTGEGCANCHDPHGAARPALLRDEQDVLCLRCHDAEIETADGRTLANMEPLIRDREFLHGPVAAAFCTACHEVHGGTHAHLLRQPFTSDFYAPYEEGLYALCFTCHSRELALTAETITLTGFRDGERNLHYLHVNRDPKGRTCRTCHEIHGSNLPKHIAESVPFEGSGWAMPIRFEATADGGTCAPGCHEQMSYRRSGGPPPAEDAAGGGAP